MREPPPDHVYVVVSPSGAECGTATPGESYINGHRRVRYVPASSLPIASKAEVERLTKRLMRHFCGRHPRFLRDYGWQQVAKCVLGAPKRRKS